MFHLDFRIPPASLKIQQKDKILLIGSCFSENIGTKLLDYKFDAESNPMGTIYNPLSCFKIIQNALLGNHAADPVENQGIYYDWNTHSDLSTLQEDELQSMMAHAYSKLAERLKSTDTIIITPGTAWVYLLRSTGQIVANCHKVPQKHFRKKLLSIKDIVDGYDILRQLMAQQGISPKWIFTVSPVRHIRDGLIENNRSKSILHLATQEICEKYDDCCYFPSYEIQIDQLRDHRYYKSDLIHPSDQAVDFIWDRFVQTHFDQDTQNFVEKWSKLLRALHHRPSHPSSESHQKFVRETILKLEQLASQVDTSSEIAQLKTHLIK